MMKVFTEHIRVIVLSHQFGRCCEAANERRVELFRSRECQTSSDWHWRRPWTGRCLQETVNFRHTLGMFHATLMDLPLSHSSNVTYLLKWNSSWIGWHSKHSNLCEEQCHQAIPFWILSPKGINGKNRHIEWQGKSRCHTPKRNIGGVLISIPEAIEPKTGYITVLAIVTYRPTVHFLVTEHCHWSFTSRPTEGRRPRWPEWLITY